MTSIPSRDNAGKPLNLLCITNRPDVARVLEICGVDWIFVDLEVLGKKERQAGRNTVQSKHTVADVRSVAISKLLVRVNPWGNHSVGEVEEVVSAGAQIVMLPYFSTADEVKAFVDAVGGRAKVCLLLETPGAVESIESILRVSGIDHIHIGLNDLHMGLGMHFMFELLADGTVERLARCISDFGVPYGFGGCARIGKLVPPAENILAEHYRLGSSSVILSRSFCNIENIQTLQELTENVRTGVMEIRTCWQDFKTQDESFFARNTKSVNRDINQVVSTMSGR